MTKGAPTSSPLTLPFETQYRVSMQGFKRNQVEEAIARLSGIKGPEQDVQLRTRLKRLLETDRALGRNLRSDDAEQKCFAFFSEEAPGTGAEVWFSEYEAFALFVGWRLLEHGWPQTSAVLVMRRARPRLQRQHRVILTWDVEELFDDAEIHARRRAGSLAVETTKPLFLVIASLGGQPSDTAPRDQTVKVFDESEMMPFLRSTPGLSATMLELTVSAHELHKALMSTTPSKRGRGSS